MKKTTQLPPTPITSEEAMFNEAKCAIAATAPLQKKIDALHEQIDVLLAPVMKVAVTAPAAQLEKLIQLLPSGFHRSELRTLLNQRQANRLVCGDTEYTLDEAYLLGARALRSGVSYDANPYNEATEEDNYSQWNYGHVNESAGEHIIRGNVDVLSIPCSGLTFRA